MDPDPGVAPLIARVLGGERHEPGEPTGERILDAAVAEAAAVGLQRLTMDAVAQRARVTRVTVYRHFTGRDRLIEALAMRETQRVLNGVAEVVVPLPDPQDRVVEAFVVGLRLAREHPIIARTALREPQSLIAALQANDAQLLRLGMAYVVQLIRGAGGQGRGVEQVAETVGRLFASFLVVPISVVDLLDDESVRSYARQVLAPLMLGRL